MKFLIKLLLVLLPLPYILYYFDPLQEYRGFFYLAKHSFIVLLTLLSCLNFLINPPKFSIRIALIFAMFLFLILYIFANTLALSEYNILYLSYISSLALVHILTITLTSMQWFEYSTFKLLYYSILLVLLSSIIFAIIFNIPLFGYWTDVVNNSTKIRWTFGYAHPGVFGSFFLILIVMPIVLIKQNLLNNFHYLVVFLSLTMMVLAHSKNSLIAAIIFLGFSFSIKSYNFSKFLFMALFPLFVIQLFTNFNYIDAFSTGRFSNWLNQFHHNYDEFDWLFGTGLGNATRIDFVSNSSDGQVSQVMYHADNSFFEVFLQFGFIGFLLLMFFMVTMFLFAMKEKDLLVKRLTTATLLSFSFFSFFDSSLLSTGNLVSIIMFLLIFQLLGYKHKC